MQGYMIGHPLVSSLIWNGCWSRNCSYLPFAWLLAVHFFFLYWCIKENNQR